MAAFLCTYPPPLFPKNCRSPKFRFHKPRVNTGFTAKNKLFSPKFVHFSMLFGLL